MSFTLLIVCHINCMTLLIISIRASHRPSTSIPAGEVIFTSLTPALGWPYTLYNTVLWEPNSYLSLYQALVRSPPLLSLLTTAVRSELHSGPNPVSDQSAIPAADVCAVFNWVLRSDTKVLWARDITEALTKIKRQEGFGLGLTLKSNIYDRVRKTGLHLIQTIPGVQQCHAHRLVYYMIRLNCQFRTELGSLTLSCREVYKSTTAFSTSQVSYKKIKQLWGYRGIISY